MLEYIYDDGGRRDAGYRGDTGDCVVRAAAIVYNHCHLYTAPHYRPIYRMMADAMKAHGYTASGNAYNQRAKKGMPKPKKSAAKVQDLVLRELGFEKVRLPQGPRPTYTEAFRDYGECIVSTTGHMAALVDGALRDTFDGRTYRMLIPYCLDCAPTFYTADLSDEPSGSGSGQDCSVCGWAANPAVLFDEVRERKARSVWVLAEL